MLRKSSQKKLMHLRLYLLLSALVGRLVIREHWLFIEIFYCSRATIMPLNWAIHFWGLLYIRYWWLWSWTACVRTYGCLRLFGDLDWIGEFFEIPRLAARQPSHYKVKLIVFISVIAF